MASVFSSARQLSCLRFLLCLSALKMRDVKQGLQGMSKLNRTELPELPQIPPKHRARVQRLIKRRCSNFDKDHCLLLDDGWLPCVCPQLSARVLNCKFFRSAVLPDDLELFGILMRLAPKRHCIICGKPLYHAANATKYCPDCSQKERRRREAERMRNRRSRIRNLT